MIRRIASDYGAWMLHFTLEILEIGRLLAEQQPVIRLNFSNN